MEFVNDNFKIIIMVIFGIFFISFIFLYSLNKIRFKPNLPTEGFLLPSVKSVFLSFLFVLVFYIFISLLSKMVGELFEGVGLACISLLTFSISMLIFDDEKHVNFWRILCILIITLVVIGFYFPQGKNYIFKISLNEWKYWIPGGVGLLLLGIVWNLRSLRKGGGGGHGGDEELRPIVILAIILAAMAYGFGWRPQNYFHGHSTPSASASRPAAGVSAPAPRHSTATDLPTPLVLNTPRAELTCTSGVCNAVVPANVSYIEQPAIYVRKGDRIIVKTIRGEWGMGGGQRECGAGGYDGTGAHIGSLLIAIRDPEGKKKDRFFTVAGERNPIEVEATGLLSFAPSDKLGEEGDNSGGMTIKFNLITNR